MPIFSDTLTIVIILTLLLSKLAFTEQKNYEELRKKKEQERMRVQFVERKLRKCIHKGDIEKCLQVGDAKTRDSLLSVYIKMMTPEVDSDPMKLFR